MADREWTDRRMIMTVDELAGVAHIPNNGSRRRTSTGATPSVAIGFLLIRISTTTQQPDTVLAIDRLDKEGRIVFDRFFGRDDDQDAASNADAASDESAESDAGPMAETSPGPQSLLGETYDITEQNTDYVGSKPVITETQNEGTVAGSYIREMLESGVDTAPSPLWIGYDEDAQRGFREAPLQFESLFRHIWITGTTGGYGKTTELLNMMVQWAYSGYGFVYFDPKGRDSLGNSCGCSLKTGSTMLSGSNPAHPNTTRRSG